MPTRKTPAKRTRQLKSPKQRAEETLGVAERRRDLLAWKVDRARAELEQLEREYAVAARRYQHASTNPDLHDENDDPLPLDELTDEGET